MRTSNPLISLALTAALALSACVSTSLVDHWKDATYGGPALHKVLVVGVQKDQGRRRVWEDSMVAALGRQGVQAEASYQVFPDQAPAPEQLTGMATRDGFDGVAATHFVMASEHTRIYGDGFGYPYGYGWRGRGFWGPPYGPPYAESETRADYQTDVFTVDATGGKLIWSGVTRSLDPSSTKSVTDEISQVLVPELLKDGVLMGKHG
jgi:hypothetical protein